MSDDYERNDSPIFPEDIAPTVPQQPPAAPDESPLPTTDAVMETRTEMPLKNDEMQSAESAEPVAQSEYQPQASQSDYDAPVEQVYPPTDEPETGSPLGYSEPASVNQTAGQYNYQAGAYSQQGYQNPAPTPAPTPTPTADAQTVYGQSAYAQAANGQATNGQATNGQATNASPYGGAYGAAPYGTQQRPGAPGVSPYSPYSPYQPPYQQPYGQPAQPPKKKNKGLKVFFSLLAVFVIIGVVFSVVVHFSKDSSDGSGTGKSTETTVAKGEAPVVETQSSPSSPAGITGSTKVLTPVQIAAKVKPSVVGIVVYSNSSGSATSEGSGVLWKEDSAGYTYVITCAHVISGSGLTYTVQSEEGTQYDAEMVGYDAKTDLGILKIKKTGLPLAEFGDSGALQVGDSVYAVGNPGGTEFFGSFTSGVVSAIDRSVKSTYTMVCIQHDAAINPGNSGGALVNSYGQVVGINSLKIINTEYEGMGFAIPIKSAQSIINSLSQYGYVPNRPKLGITYAEAIDYQQYSMIVKIKGLPSGSLIITEIGKESDLANTEAKQYDMIIAVDGEELTTPNVLLDKIENSKVGDKITLKLCRIDNNYAITEFDVEVKLVEDKGEAVEETTTQYFFDPYDFFNGIY